MGRAWMGLRRDAGRGGRAERDRLEALLFAAVGGLAVAAYMVIQNRPDLGLLAGADGLVAVRGRVEAATNFVRWSAGRRTSSDGLWLDVVYVYEVGGREYRGNRFRPAGLYQYFGSGDDASAERLRFGRGSPITVYYDPADPARSCRSDSTDGWVSALGVPAVGIALSLVLGPVYFVGARRRSERVRRHSGGASG